VAGKNKLRRETAAEQKWLQPLLQKVCKEGAEERWSGRLCQKREAALENALSPTVDSHIGSTISAAVDDDLSHCHNWYCDPV